MFPSSAPLGPGLPLPATHRPLLNTCQAIVLFPAPPPPPPPRRPLGSPQPPPHACAVGGHHPAARAPDASIPAASDSFITPRPEPARPIRCQVRGLPATNQSRASPPAVAFRQWEKARGPDRRGTRTPRARRRRQQRARGEHNMAAAGRTELQQRPREGSEVSA